MSHRGKIWWNELNTRDVEGAKALYARVLGWEFEETPMGDGAPPYWLIKRQGAVVGGVFTLAGPEMEGVPDSWMTYLAVDDLTAALEALKSAGGSVLKPPFEVSGVGVFAIVADAGGAVSGLIQPAEGDG